MSRAKPTKRKPAAKTRTKKATRPTAKKATAKKATAKKATAKKATAKKATAKMATAKKATAKKAKKATTKKATTKKAARRSGPIKNKFYGYVGATKVKSPIVKVTKQGHIRPSARAMFDHGRPIGTRVVYGGKLHELAMRANGSPYLRKV
jgi:predicted phage tail protein